MRAVVHERYGPPEVMEVREVPVPDPGRGEIRVTVHATTVNRTDTGFLRGRPGIVRLFAGLRRPRRTILGTEFAGVVDALGPGVTRFAVGDRVFGINPDRFGAHAERLCLGERRPVARIPDGVDMVHAAAAADGGILALAYLRATRVGPDTRLLVYGASGAIGSATVQIAKHLGAHVSAYTQPAGLAAVRALRPDETFDHEDRIREAGQPWDVVIDAVGQWSFAAARPVLIPHGVYTSTDFGPHHQNPLLAVGTRLTRGPRVRFPLPRATQADVEHLAGLLADGDFSPVIDRVVPFEGIVDAARYVESERKIGNVVVAVEPHVA